MPFFAFVFSVSSVTLWLGSLGSFYVGGHCVVVWFVVFSASHPNQGGVWPADGSLTTLTLLICG
jgi:hypothetical protein